MPLRRRLGIAAAVLALASCEAWRSLSDHAASAPDASVGAQAELPIGLVAALTGPEAAFGISAQMGIRLAIDEVNEDGGIKGRRLKLVVRDDGGRPEEAAAAVAQLASEDKAVLVLGEGTSAASIAMAPVVEQIRLPMISHAATSPKVTEASTYAFRVCFTDTFQGYAMAKFARETLGLNRVGVALDPRSDYSSGLAKAFASRFRKMGGQVVREVDFHGPGGLSTEVAGLGSAAPEAIYVAGYYNDVARLAKQLREAGIDVPLLGGDGWSSERLAEAAGAEVEGGYFTNHYSPQDPSPHVQRFVAAFKAAYRREPDSIAALGYDAVRVAADALARAKSLEGPDVRDAIAQTRELPGVTGVLTIDARRNASKPAVILKLVKGRPVFQATVPPEERR